MKLLRPQGVDQYLGDLNRSLLVNRYVDEVNGAVCTNGARTFPLSPRTGHSRQALRQKSAPLAGRKFAKAICGDGWKASLIKG